MLVSTLSVQLERLRNINSRNELSAVLSELVKLMSGKEAKELVYLLQCRVAPKFVPIEFNLADKQLIKFFSEFLKVPQFDEEYLKYGDMGDTVYYLLKNTSKESNYNISELYADLLTLANTTGKDSVKIKANLLKGIFDRSDRLSSKYIARILSGNLRLGFSDKTILDALSIYLSGDKSKTDEVERAYGAMSDLGILTEHILSKKKLVLSDIHITPGIPVASKLVEREKDADSIWERMPNCMVQAKYDGLRCQIHIIEEGKDIENFKVENTQSSLLQTSPKRVKLFSRNQEETTDMFPDLVLEAEKLKVKSVVLDSEVIGINPKTGKFIPFQETMQRKRKYNISEFAYKSSRWE
jgi:DNA ligase-1